MYSGKTHLNVHTQSMSVLGFLQFEEASPICFESSRRVKCPIKTARITCSKPIRKSQTGAACICRHDPLRTKVKLCHEPKVYHSLPFSETNIHVAGWKIPNIYIYIYTYIYICNMFAIGKLWFSHPSLNFARLACYGQHHRCHGE